MKELDEIYQIINEKVIIDGKEYLLREEYEKFYYENNKTAGIRVRKIMQMIRKRAATIRKNIQTLKKL